MRRRSAAIAAAIIVVVLVIYIICAVRADMRFLGGIWYASGDSFCEQADIDSMMLYIDTDGGFKRASYILVAPDITMQEITINVGRPIALGKYKVSIEFTDEDDAPMPSDLELHLDRKGGLLRLVDGETIYARLYRRYDLDG